MRFSIFQYDACAEPEKKWFDGYLSLQAGLMHISGNFVM